MRCGALKKPADKIFKKASVGLIQSVGELIKSTFPSSTFWFWLVQVGVDVVNYYQLLISMGIALPVSSNKDMGNDEACSAPRILKASRSIWTMPLSRAISRKPGAVRNDSIPVTCRSSLATTAIYRQSR